MEEALYPSPFYPDGLAYLTDGPGAGMFAFRAGQVVLYFRHDEFYRFVVLVCDAEEKLQRHYGEQAATLGQQNLDEIDTEFSRIEGFGRIYECRGCSRVHADVAEQRVVVAPGSVWYLLALVRASAVALENWTMNHMENVRRGHERKP